LKPGHPVLIERDYFAIENRFCGLELFGHVNQFGYCAVISI
jgi:hypothetical protein